MLGQIAGVPACNVGKLEGRAPVVGEHLSVVLRAAQRVDPLGDEPVLLGAFASRYLPVGDVAQEHVGEGPLAFALDR